VSSVDFLGLAAIPLPAAAWHKKHNLGNKNGTFSIDSDPDLEDRLWGHVKITFEPSAKDCPPCKNIRFVQAVQTLDKGGSFVDWSTTRGEENRNHLRTVKDDAKKIAGGWFIDHLAKRCRAGDKKCEIYYGDHNKQGKDATNDGITGGAGFMRDNVGSVQGEAKYFETCIRCVDTGSAANGKYLGCLVWDFSDAGITMSKATDGPSATFSAAVDVFNNFYSTK